MLTTHQSSGGVVLSPFHIIVILFLKISERSGNWKQNERSTWVLVPIIKLAWMYIYCILYVHRVSSRSPRHVGTHGWDFLGPLYKTGCSINEKLQQKHLSGKPSPEAKNQSVLKMAGKHGSWPTTPRNIQQKLDQTPNFRFITRGFSVDFPPLFQLIQITKQLGVTTNLTHSQVQACQGFASHRWRCICHCATRCPSRGHRPHRLVGGELCDVQQEQGNKAHL